MNTTLIVLAASGAAAAVAALGAVPFAGRSSIPTAWVGWANALAAGMMLGAAYVLSSAQLGEPATGAWPPAVGAAVGALFIAWTHRALGTETLDLNRLDETEALASEPVEADRAAKSEIDPAYGYRVVLVNVLHSASEGVAIGVAMVVDVSFGLFLALAIGFHNIPEATVLTAVVKARGVSTSNAAGLAVATNLSQVLLAITAYAVVGAAPVVLPWALGFSVGALIHLVLVELLPEAYREVGHTSIALVTSVTMAIVVLLKSMLSGVFG